MKLRSTVRAFCQRNKSRIALAVLFIFMSSLSVYVLSNYHLVPKNTQTTQVGFTVDDMHLEDWAAGDDYSYGFYTMVDRVVDTYLGRKGQHKSYLEGLQYTAKEDKRYGNSDANILEIYKGAYLLLPDFMRTGLGNDITMEVQSLNRGELVVIIYKENKIILNLRFNQDKVATITTNSFDYSPSQLVQMYHYIRKGIEQRVNTN